jgi:hypothetical protein
VPDLPLLDEPFHGARDVLDRNLGIDAVLIEEIDPVGLEARKRRVGDLADVRGTAVQADRLLAFELEPELGRDDDAIAHGSERFADEILVREGAVRFRGVEERDPRVHRRAEDRDPPPRGRLRARNRS